LSAKVAVASLKKYIVEDRYRIKLNDLVLGEANKLVSGLSSEAFLTKNIPFSPNELMSRIVRYEALTETLLSLIISGCHWGRGNYDQLWVRTLERTASSSEGKEGTVVWADLRLYPALLLLYAGGIASIVGNRYDTFGSLLTKPKLRQGAFIEGTLLLELYPEKVLESRYAQNLPGMERDYTPLNNRLHQLLREPLREILTEDLHYEECFDRFEYLRALVHADLMEKQGLPFAGPAGRFAWKLFRKPKAIDDIHQEVHEQKEQWPPLQAGLFNGSVSRFIEVENRYLSLIRQLNW
jgi:hypothetical protein